MLHRSLLEVPASMKGRPAETDSTVMMMCGLVLILIVLLAVVSGVAMWKARQVEELRAKYETPSAVAAMPSVRYDGPGTYAGPDVSLDEPSGLMTADLSVEELVALLQQFTRPPTLVGASANGLLPLLPIVALSLEDSPPPSIRFLIK